MQHLLDAELGVLALLLVLLGRLVLPLPDGHGQVVRHHGRLPRRLQDAGAVPAAHVGAQAHADALLEQPAHARPPARQRRVAARAVRDLGPALRDEVRFVVGQVDRVAEDRARAQQPERVVHGGVRRALGEHGPHQRDLRPVLRDVRLHGQARGPLQRAELRHGVARAGRREPRRQDRAHEREVRVDAPDVVDALLRARERLRRRLVPVVVRAHLVVVHAHAADEGALAHGQAEVREQVRRLDVDGRVVGGGGGAVGQHAPDAACVHSARFG